MRDLCEMCCETRNLCTVQAAGNFIIMCGDCISAEFKAIRLETLDECANLASAIAKHKSDLKLLVDREVRALYELYDLYASQIADEIRALKG